MKRLLSLAAGLLFAVAASVGTATPASAAATCNQAHLFRTSWGVYRAQPTYNGSTACNLGFGNRGEGVKFLQYTLNYCYGAGIAIDGDFGPKTWQALANAQKKAGITPDGIYGPQSRLWLKHPTRYTVVYVSTNTAFNGCSSGVLYA